MDVNEHQQIAGAFQLIMDTLVAAYGWDAAATDCIGRLKEIERRLIEVEKRVYNQKAADLVLKEMLK